MLPVSFRKKMAEHGEKEPYRFVIKKDMYEKCLELYTMEAWENKQTKILSMINDFLPDDNRLYRDFKMGATEVECDTTGRILIQKDLFKLAEITNEAILSGSYGKIEIWSPELYYNSGGDVDAKKERAQRILGNQNKAKSP